MWAQNKKWYKYNEQGELQMGRNIEMLVYKFMTSKSQRITELPIERETLYEVCAMRGWELNTYHDGIDLIKEYKLDCMVDKADGFACRSDFGEIHIFYDSNLSYEDQVRTIAHEIGHIALKHTCYKVFGQSKSQDVTEKQEAEANEFMLYFLAQPLILRECGVKTADEVEKMTYLNHSDAEAILTKIKSDRVTVDEEMQLLDQFAGFIHNYRWKKITRKSKMFFRKPLPYTATIIALMLGIFMVVGIYTNRTQDGQAPTTTPYQMPQYTTTPTLLPEVIPEVETVYIAKTSSDVYHAYVDCSYINGRDGVYSIPYSQVGARRLCSRCKTRFNK